MTCPLCHQPTTWEGNPWRPFCCERCQITDLGTWAAEHYRIPGPPLTTETGIQESLAQDERTREGNGKASGSSTD
ncbi:MAG: DNA gyrase inhibitor YacG [Nitrospira sp.]|nr:DNA gyrase inhibitor YacG [Nitrospira sp.]